MIASPCRKCSKKYFPKDKCIDTCKELKLVRSIQLAIGEQYTGNAIDPSADDRYRVISPA